MSHYAINLRSRYTGEEVKLGARYKTLAEAQHAVETGVCTKCNYADIYQIGEHWEWRGKKQGFLPTEKETT